MTFLFAFAMTSYEGDFERRQINSFTFWTSFKQHIAPQENCACGFMHKL